MTKEQSLLSERNYELFWCEQELRRIKEGWFYDSRYYRKVCLYKVPFCDMTDEMFQQLDEWYEREQFLKEVIAGRKQHLMARIYYRKCIKTLDR